MTVRKYICEIPELVAQFSDRNTQDPHEIGVKSKKKFWWVCDKGHEWDATPFSRTIPKKRSSGSAIGGCPYCLGKRVLAGFNDVATTDPELVEDWSEDNELYPQELTRGSRKKIQWKCHVCSHEWTTELKNRTVLGRKCPACSGKRINPGFNDMLTVHPELEQMWDYDKNSVDPRTVASTNVKDEYFWKCEKGHSFSSTPGNMAKYHRCKICTGKLTMPGVNDLATTHPDILKQWDYAKNELTPQQVTAGSGKTVWWICETTGKSYERVIWDMVSRGSASPYETSSTGETEVSEFVEFVYDGEIIRKSRKVINPYELDIFLPQENIAIEYNGIYWHSDAAGKDKNYHYNKWLKCKEQGIQLITIWEDDWINKREIVCSAIKHKLGAKTDEEKIPARKTIVSDIDYHDAARFLDSYHIQGKASGSLYAALKSKDTGEMVAVSVWRKSGENLYLDRYATSCIIPGGMGKLLSYARKWGKEQGCNEIVTFSDNEISDGDLYLKLGFTLDKELPVDYKYIYKGKRKHKFGFRLKRFREDDDLDFEESLTESQLAQINHIPRVWDCGKMRWTLPL